MEGVTVYGMKSILHIITGLNDGGAEAVLYRLCTAKQDNTTHHVISLMDLGKYGPLLQDHGITVQGLGSKKGVSATFHLFGLARIIRQSKPDVVQTWMYHANLIGGIAAKLARCKKIVWGIRHTNLEHNKKSTRLVSCLCARLSRQIPAAIVCCSDSAVETHKQYGYAANKLSVIYNGYNLDSFMPSEEYRRNVRQELGVAENDILLGMVGRWSPQKDHANLLASLAIVKNTVPSFKCLIIGPNNTPDNIELVALISQNNLKDQVHLLGRRTDIPAMMNALDLHILSSAFGEAFPNVVAEAMACGTPCVATNVGDAAMIVGNPDWVAPPKAPEKLAAYILKCLGDIKQQGREFIGTRCRQRIVDNFSLDRMVQSYQNLWNRLTSPYTSSS